MTNDVTIKGPTDEQQRLLDRITAAMMGEKQAHIDFPITNRFTPGLYVREMFMPKFAIVVSRIHKTTHPFVISKGKVDVWCPNHGWQRLEAPHTGITKPGTQRLLMILEDTIWTTFHPGPWDGNDPQEIVEMVSAAPDLEYLKGMKETVLEALGATPGLLKGATP